MRLKRGGRHQPAFVNAIAASANTVGSRGRSCACRWLWQAKALSGSVSMNLSIKTATLKAAATS